MSREVLTFGELFGPEGPGLPVGLEGAGGGGRGCGRGGGRVGGTSPKTSIAEGSIDADADAGCLCEPEG
jgi:hypothetical protein